MILKKLTTKAHFNDLRAGDLVACRWHRHIRDKDGENKRRGSVHEIHTIKPNGEIILDSANNIYFNPKMYLHGDSTLAEIEQIKFTAAPSSTKINQALIERILKRAEALPMGIDPPSKIRSLSDYKPSDAPNSLAMLLVGMFHEKYDLVAVFQAMFEELTGPARTTCPRDTDGDGDCPSCFGKGCTWGSENKATRSSDSYEEGSLEARAVELIKKERKASTPLFQRHLRLGWTRAAALSSKLEDDGILGPQVGAAPREILLP